MRDHKLRYAIGKLIDDKVAAAFDLDEALRATDELFRQLSGAPADARVGGTPDIERRY